MAKINEVKGTIVFSDGREHSFSIDASLGSWQQWGASMEQLGEACDLLTALNEATGDVENWGDEEDEPENEDYCIIRFYRHDSNAKHIVKRGLTLDEAQAHCEREDTSCDDWFDGFSTEDNYPNLIAAFEEAE